MSSARVFEIVYGTMYTGMAVHTNITGISHTCICQVSLCFQRTFLRQFLTPAQFDCFRFPKLINTELEVFLTFFSINLEGLRGKIQ